MDISLVAAVDENNGLGKNNELLCHLPADLKHFKELTLGKTIIMGRKTFQSIGRPLPQRQNIVLSKHAESIDGVEVAHSFDDALKLAASRSEIMIIGGEAVFQEALSRADNVYLTIIHHQFEADVHFPTLNKSIWHCLEKKFRQRDEKNIYDLTFCHYQRIK